MSTTRRQFLSALGASAAAAALWTPSLSTAFAPRASTLDGDPDDPVIAGLLERQRRLWQPGADRAALERMRRLNPEWDFMGRTFGGLAMLAAVRRKPALADALLPPVDRLLAHTLSELRARGKRHFLLPYGWGFRNPDKQSLFVDGELLALVATREELCGDGRFAEDQAWLAERVRQNMDAGPLGHGESYGNECWAFCNAFAAMGLRVDQRTSARWHEPTVARYLANLPIDEGSGMVHSEYTYDGRPQDGPEGSSLFLVATLLDQVDPGRGRHQYELGRDALLRRFLGFGYAREWAPGVKGIMDVDSGPIVPVFEASTAASGLAILATAAFDDRDNLSALLSSLWATAFPTWDDGALHFAASNAVGDAVMLFGLLRAAHDLGGLA